MKPGDLPDAVAALLLDMELPIEPCPTWQQHRAVLLPFFVRRHPGRRPSRWWLYDAPRQPPGRFEGWWCDGRVEEPRLRLGGTGTAAMDAFAVEPRYHCGIPVEWVTADELVWCAAEGIAAALIDPAAPPRYESQARYLERHGLFLRGEEKRLPADAFEPERVLP